MFSLGLRAVDAHTLFITGDDLTIDQVVSVSRSGFPVALSSSARERVEQSRSVLEEVAANKAIYGMNRQFGPFSKESISEDDVSDFQTEMVLGHAVKSGEKLSSEVVRAMMLSRINGFARGTAGISLNVVELLIIMLNMKIHPVVFAGCSVGQSDLSEMAQIASILIGHGEVEYQGRTRPAREIFALLGLSVCTLKGKEALSLISSNGLTLGRGALVCEKAQKTMDLFNLAAAMSLEGFGGNLSMLHPAASRAKAHPGYLASSISLRKILTGSYLWQEGQARNLQDPLSFRCIPLVHGALHEEIEHLKKALEIELNSGGDNPLVSIENNDVFSVGNFDVTNLAVRFDALKIALAHAIKLSNERIQKLLWTDFSALPTGLERECDKLTRLVQLGRTAAAWAAEALTFAQPASLSYSAQIASGIEDTASMAPLTISQTLKMIGLARSIAAIEILIAYTACDLRGVGPHGVKTKKIADSMRLLDHLSAANWHERVEYVLNNFDRGWPSVDLNRLDTFRLEK